MDCIALASFAHTHVPPQLVNNFQGADSPVMKSAAILPDADMLIGLDVLLKYKMSLDGPGDQFTLEF